MDRAMNPYDGSRRRLKSAAHKSIKDYDRKKNKQMKSMTERMDWIVRLYNKYDVVIESYIIQDRSNHEATNEAMYYVESVSECEDWSIEIYEPC